jgi:hypothetical protein
VVHAVADEQEMLRCTAGSEELGLGMLWTVHVDPSQLSANGCEYPVPGLKPPTASHAVADTQLTALKPGVKPSGLAAVRSVQAVPSHLSASVPEPERSVLMPTARHTLADGHEIPNGWAVSEPAGLGIGWIVHAEPFQDSARGSSLFPVVE